jgi:hypothetical protein
LGHSVLSVVVPAARHLLSYFTKTNFHDLTILDGIELEMVKIGQLFYSDHRIMGLVVVYLRAQLSELGHFFFAHLSPSSLLCFPHGIPADAVGAETSAFRSS